MVSPNIPVKNERVERGSTHILATWGIAGFIAIACTVLIGLEASHIITAFRDPGRQPERYGQSYQLPDPACRADLSNR